MDKLNLNISFDDDGNLIGIEGAEAVVVKPEHRTDPDTGDLMVRFTAVADDASPMTLTLTVRKPGEASEAAASAMAKQLHALQYIAGTQLLPATQEAMRETITLSDTANTAVHAIAGMLLGRAKGDVFRAKQYAEAAINENTAAAHDLGMTADDLNASLAAVLDAIDVLASSGS